MNWAVQLSQRGWLNRLLAYVLLGFVAALGHAPFGQMWATVLAFVVVFFAIAAEAGWRRIAFAAWAFGLGYFAVSLHWIVQPFFVDVARHGWMAPFALLFMAAGMALFWAIAGAVAAMFVGGSRVWALVAGFVTAELARSLVLTGFPWALLGHVWIDTPIAQLAATVGPHGLSFVTVAIPALIVGLWGRKPWMLAPAAVCAAGWVALDPGPVPAPTADAPIVRLIQPNARQDLKWDPGMADTLFRRLLDLTARGGANADPDVTPDLVVWPETSVQWLLEYSEGVLRDVSLAAGGAPTVLGILRRDTGRYYNSMVVVDRAGEVTDLYDKWHLVPFGEYIPLGEMLARIGITGFAPSQGGGYSAGTGPALIDIPGLGPALPLICYEGIFPEEVNAAPGRARMMILITNDAWFGNWAGPAQHFAQAQLRAIEQGLPLIRVANTGISGMIDSKGRVTGQLPLNVAGALDLPLPDALSPTIYTKTGDWPVIVLLNLLFVGAWLRTRRLAVDRTEPEA